LLLTVSILLASAGEGKTAQPSAEGLDSTYRGIQDRAKGGVRAPLTRTHVYWDKGLHIEDAKDRFRLKIGGKIMFDVGSTDADDELKAAFSDLDGSEADFRILSVTVSGTVYDTLEFRAEIDFAHVREIKDNWIRLTKPPLLQPFRFGHMKEPFSLERSTSLTNVTFMEPSLPGRALGLGRNIGIRYDRALLGDRMTLALGGFFNTGSLEDAGEAIDRISEANGYNLTGRVTGLPWYEEEGGRLLHLGLSYSHGVREDDDEGDQVRFRTRPETRLTDERLVDTGNFFADIVNRINAEAAIVSGPLSVQGEGFYAFTDADDKGDPQFWGFYLYGSYFLTGENRNYKTSEGVFSRIKPHNTFRPLSGGWGAWELGLRLSYVDLNGEKIDGGQETNFTAGLNWYLTPHARIMFNYIRALVEDRVDREIDDGRANIFQARFQLAY
jgi:phosphate-selective porin OprO/OprP